MNVDDILRPDWTPTTVPCVHCGTDGPRCGRCTNCHRFRDINHDSCWCIGLDPVPAVEPAATLARNGARQIRFWCTLCDLPRGGVISHKACRAHGWDPHAVPVKRNHARADDITRSCARCGSTGPVEYHHFAPWSLFEDANDWPTAFLCPPCHREWHQRTGLGLSNAPKERRR